uniref:Uncharacterized protein n=1 Tax=Anguilla anguilla TaxID=7936 RepID=A0A0E9QCF4_ANGAN
MIFDCLLGHFQSSHFFNADCADHVVYTPKPTFSLMILLNLANLAQIRPVHFF